MDHGIGSRMLRRVFRRRSSALSASLDDVAESTHSYNQGHLAFPTAEPNPADTRPALEREDWNGNTRRPFAATRGKLVHTRRQPEPHLTVMSSTDDDISDANDPLVVSIKNLFSPQTPRPDACDQQPEHLHHQDQLGWDIQVQRTERQPQIQPSHSQQHRRDKHRWTGQPVRELEMDPQFGERPEQCATSTEPFGTTTYPKFRDSVAPVLKHEEAGNCEMSSESQNIVGTSSPTASGTAQDVTEPDTTTPSVPTIASNLAVTHPPLYVPDTLEQSPVEMYSSRTPCAERVAVALEKLAGTLRSPHTMDKSDHFLGRNASDTLRAGNGGNNEQEMRTETFGSLLQQLGSSKRGSLCTSAPSPTIPLTEDVVPLVIESMVQHRTDPRVADRALTTLRRLTAREAAREKIGNCGGIEVLIDIMRIHSLRVRIQTQVCLVLANVTYRNPMNKQRVLRARGFQAVVASMALHRTVEHIQAWGSLALRNFSNSNFSSLQDANIVAGAVDVLVNALEVCPKSRVVLNQAPVALGNIATSSPEGMARIRLTGGIQVVMTVCRNNITSASLVDSALSCIRALTSDDENQKLFGLLGGIELITDCMNQHRGNTGIAVKGCASLRYLSFHRENRERIGACGGINAIVSAIMDTKDGNEDVAEHILKALSNSIYDSVINKTLAGRAGGVVATLALISSSPFKDSARVAEDGCRALRNLADGVIENHTLFMKHRGLAIVLDIVRAHGLVSEGVAEHGVALFVNLATNPNIAGQLRGGSGDIASTALQMRSVHSASPRVDRQVSNLLQLIHPTTGKHSRGSVERSIHLRRSYGSRRKDFDGGKPMHSSMGDLTSRFDFVDANRATSFGSASLSSGRRSHGIFIGRSAV